MNDSVQLYNKQLSIVTKPIPKLSCPTDVLLRISYAGVCGTDLHILSGEFPASEKAVTLGHEFCGVVEEVGHAVAHVAKGDRVVINPNDNCHVCIYCVNGDPHFCKNGGIRSTTGIWKNGGWSHFCRVAAVLVHKIPSSMSLSRAVFTEPFSCIARGWNNLGEMKPDAKVLVCGAGIIGLLWASLLHFKGYREFVVSEISVERQKLAANMDLGLKVVHPEHVMNLYREAKRVNDAEWGFDVIVDCTGAPAAIEQSFQWLRYGGKFLLFGCCPQESEIKLNPFDIVLKELTIIGSLINPYTFPKALALVDRMSSYLDYGKLGVKLYQLQDYADALSDLKSGQISKAVFKIEESQE